jgi:hypothetical protein
MFASPVKAINDLFIHPLPRKTLENATVVPVNSKIHYIVANGKVYSSESSRFTYSFGYPGVINHLKALAKSGVISKSDVAEHNRQLKKLKSKQKRAIAAKVVMANIRDAGLTLTQNQLTKMKLAINDLRT